MIRPDFTGIVKNAVAIIKEIGQESVDVYLFLFDEFRRGPILDNHVFQFVYRSFYRIDNAGLRPEFKAAYFHLLEEFRDSSEIDLRYVAEKLHEIPNQRGYRTLQFSFITKLAHTACPNYPMYDAQVAKVFHFQARYDKSSDSGTRLSEYLGFYADLRQLYERILSDGPLQGPLQLFRETYGPASCRVPPIKVLDFIFWSAGRLSIKL
jgi:hypothetical protein